MSTDLPAVSVWAPDGGQYALVGSLLAYESLTFNPRFLEAGTWEMSLPLGVAASGVTADKLYTIDWRGSRTTWCLDSFSPESNAQGGVTLTVGGPSALSVLGRELAWPDPTVGLGSQPVPADSLVTGPAETVIRTLIQGNYVNRRGSSLVMGSNAGLGTTVQARPKFHNLLELVTRKARKGGIGVDVNLVNTTSTRASLRLRVWVPADLTSRVLLSEKIGNLLGWKQANTAPTATRVIVTGATGGVGDIYRNVETAEGTAVAATWGGHRVAFVQGPSSYDNVDLDEAGFEAIEDGTATTNVEFEAADTSGLMAFRDYNVGDKVTGQLNIGLDVEDVISGINVSVSEGYPQITPTFGNPNAQEPMVSMAELVQKLNRRIRLLEQRS